MVDKYRPEVWYYGLVHITFSFAFSASVGLVHVPCHTLVIVNTTIQFLCFLTMVWVRPHSHVREGCMDMTVEGIKLVLVNNSAMPGDNPQHIFGLALQWVLVMFGLFKLMKACVEFYQERKKKKIAKREQDSYELRLLAEDGEYDKSKVEKLRSSDF
eukprot:PhF_6_TR13704/c0_g1_i1/m.22133